MAVFEVAVRCVSVFVLGRVFPGLCEDVAIAFTSCDFLSNVVFEKGVCDILYTPDILAIPTADVLFPRALTILAECCLIFAGVDDVCLAAVSRRSG